MIFPLPGLQEACPHIRNTKLVYIEAQIRHLGKSTFSNHRETKEWLSVHTAGHTGWEESLLSSNLEGLANYSEEKGMAYKDVLEPWITKGLQWTCVIDGTTRLREGKETWSKFYVSFLKEGTLLIHKNIHGKYINFSIPSAMSFTWISKSR